MARGVLGIWGAMAMLALQSVSTQAAPRLVVDQPIYDFGSVEQGTPVEHVFAVRNGGDAPLRIERVEGTCACTVGTTAGVALAPGDFTYVSVHLDTSRLSGRTVKTMWVHTDDPLRPAHPLTLTGAVATDFVLSPPAVYLGRVRSGETVRREIRILRGRDDVDARAQTVETGTAAVRARLEPVSDGDAQTVVVEVDGAIGAGRFDDVVRLRTTSSRQPWLEVPIFGVVETDLAVLPPRVTFGVNAGGAAPADIHIRNRGRRPVAVTRVTVPEAVDYELTTLRSGVEYRLTLRLRVPPAHPEAFEGQVEVLTDHPAEKRIVVPVYAIDRRRG